jgi:hypothetical protein
MEPRRWRSYPACTNLLITRCYKQSRTNFQGTRGRPFMNPKNTERLIKALSSNWQAEMRGYYTYNTLSQQENDPYRRRTLRNLALVEKHHADLWHRGSLHLVQLLRPTKSRSLKRPTPSPIASVTRTSPCAAWSWTRAATLRVTANKFTNWAMNPVWPSSKRSWPTKPTTTSR